MSVLFDLLAISAATAAVIAVWLQTRHLRRSTQGQLFIELRKLCDEEKDIANSFRPGGERHVSVDMSRHENDPDLDAYLGLLEFCNILIEDGSIDQDTFIPMFGYRVELIANHPAIAYRLSSECPTDWQVLGRLINRVKRHPHSKPSSRLGRWLGIEPQGT